MKITKLFIINLIYYRAKQLETHRVFNQLQ